jgi:hypothetical protein
LGPADQTRETIGNNRGQTFSSVILGFSMLTVTHLKAKQIWLGWLPTFASPGSAQALWAACGWFSS